MGFESGRRGCGAPSSVAHADAYPSTTDPTARVGLDTLSPVLRALDGTLPCNSRLTVEPGGQLEISTLAFDQVDAYRFRHPARWRRWRPDRAPRSCRLDQLDQPAANPSTVLAP